MPALFSHLEPETIPKQFGVVSMVLVLSTSFFGIAFKSEKKRSSQNVRSDVVDWNMAINAAKQWSRGLVLLQTLGPKPGGAVAARHFLAGSNGFNYNKRVCLWVFT